LAVVGDTARDRDLPRGPLIADEGAVAGALVAAVIRLTPYTTKLENRYGRPTVRTPVGYFGT
jgi:hypothetical protein